MRVGVTVDWSVFKSKGIIRTDLRIGYFLGIPFGTIPSHDYVRIIGIDVDFNTSHSYGCTGKPNDAAICISKIIWSADTVISSIYWWVGLYIITSSHICGEKPLHFSMVWKPVLCRCEIIGSKKNVFRSRNCPSIQKIYDCGGQSVMNGRDSRCV